MWTKKDTIEMKMKDKRMEEESLVHLKETAELSQQLCDTIDEMIKDEDEAIAYYRNNLTECIKELDNYKNELKGKEREISEIKEHIRKGRGLYSEENIRINEESLESSMELCKSKKRCIVAIENNIKSTKKCIKSHEKGRQHLIEWREKAIAHHVFDVNYVNFSEDLVRKYAAEIEELQRQVNYDDKRYGRR